jgi:hypothetical protein
MRRLGQGPYRKDADLGSKERGRGCLDNSNNPRGDPRGRSCYEAVLSYRFRTVVRHRLSRRIGD